MAKSFAFTSILAFQVSIVFGLSPTDLNQFMSESGHWIGSNVVRVQKSQDSFASVTLYRQPQRNDIFMKPMVEAGGSSIDLFALGRFLSVSDAEKIIPRLYGAIPDKAKAGFFPFGDLDHFEHSLFFTPSALFGNPWNDGLNQDYDIPGNYVICYSDPNGRDFVFSTQKELLGGGNANSYLVFPSSFYISVFRITGKTITLVSYRGVN